MLTRGQADRAGRRLAGLVGAQRATVRDALRAATPGTRPVLYRALAGGHPIAEVVRLAALVADRPPGWVAQRLSLVDDGPGPQYRFGARISQIDSTTCGTTVLVVLAARADPLIALRLTDPDAVEQADPDAVDETVPDLDPTGETIATGGTGPAGPRRDGGSDAGFGRRFGRAQLAVHRDSNRYWPRSLGSSPAGMAGWLARRVPGLGRYRVLPLVGLPPRCRSAVVDRIDRAVARGEPVPLLVGNVLPRHWVLAMTPHPVADRNDPTATEHGWRVFEPSSGEVRVVPVSAWRGDGPPGRLAALVWFDRPWAALLPEDTGRWGRHGPSAAGAGS